MPNLTKTYKVCIAFKGGSLMKIGISAESAIDLPKNLLDEYAIQTVPFTITLGDRTEFDGVITPDQIFAYVDETGKLPKTSAVNEYQFEEHFNKLLSQYDYVIHFSLSSKLSSACENARKVASHLNGRVRIIDTRTLSTGIALLAIYARELIDKGEDIDAIVSKCEARVPHIQVSSVINNLNYLYKGGRCSALQRFGANLFKIRPQITVVDGGMASRKLYRGKDAAVVKKYCEDTLEMFSNPDKSIAFVTATNYPDEIIDMGEKLLRDFGFKKILRTTAGSTISSYCGDKTIGVFFIDDGGNK